jgi:hypothetical protein
MEHFPLEEPDPIAEQVTHVVKVGPFAAAKRASLLAHESQFGPDHPLNALPEEAFDRWSAAEYFIQAWPPAGPGAEAIGDLFT